MYLIKVYCKWKHVVCCHVGFEHCFYVNNLRSPSKFTLSELHYTVVASVMIKRRLQTM